MENGVATRYWGRPDDLIEEIEVAGFRIDQWRVFDEYKQPLFFGEAVKD